MVVRSDAWAIFGISVLFVFFILFFQPVQQPARTLKEVIDFHAIMSIRSIPQDRAQHLAWDHQVHLLLPELNAALDIDTTSTEKSRHYRHKPDHLFITHAHGEVGSYCFHLPKNISFETFTATARSLFQREGFEVSFHRDYKIKLSANSLNNPIVGYEGQTISMLEYEKYGNLPLSNFDTLIAQETNVTKKTRLQQLKEMRPSINWHLKIAAMGILPDDVEIPDTFKPLSWLFSAWELAPHRGAGVVIANIDTGSCGAEVTNGATQRMEKHPNIESFEKIASYALNLVSENGLDPVHQLAIAVKKYCRKEIDLLDIERLLPNIIIDFLTTNKAVLLQNFLLEMGNNLAGSNKSLNKAGTAAVEDILYGDCGIVPNHDPAAGFFTVIQLNEQPVLFQSLPAPLIKKNMPSISAHGTFTQGIIHGQGDSTGIAPHARLFPIKALEDNGSTTKQSLDHALRKAMMVKADVVNLSLKASELFDSADADDILMKQLIDSFDYVVAAAGNDGNPKSSAYVGTKEAYPARFESVAFDVGGFMLDNYQYTYGHFSQHEPAVGPKIIAPGFNMLSSGINTKTGEMCKIFMGGTSAAVPVITGSIALVLGEFKNIFSRKTILKVMYASAIKMNGDSEWENNVGLGMIDLRSSLLCLHVLQEIKIKKLFDLDSKENNIISAILGVILNNANTFSKKTKIVDLKSNFSSFRNSCLKSTISIADENLIITNGKDRSISGFVQLIIQILQGDYPDGAKTLQAEVHKILTAAPQTDLELLSFFGDNKIIDRVSKTLDFTVDRAHYWHQSIDDNIIKKGK